MTTSATTVLIVDDHAVVRNGLSGFLEPATDIEVIGEASSGREAVLRARELRPDVILMDVRMPDGDGISATAELAPEGHTVIVLTTFDQDEYVFGAIESGAAGFLLKDTGPDELAAAIRTAARGDGLISPAVTRRVLHEFARRLPSADEDTRAAKALLTERELDLVRALGEGLTNQELAARLHIEVSTVKAHLSQVIAKTGVRNRVAIVAWAFRNRLVS